MYSYILIVFNREPFAHSGLESYDPREPDGWGTRSASQTRGYASERSSLFVDFSRGMLALDPRERRSAAEMLEYGWLKS
jgi:hypothetical protein